jgi:hypothetical protein
MTPSIISVTRICSKCRDESPKREKFEDSVGLGNEILMRALLGSLNSPEKQRVSRVIKLSPIDEAMSLKCKYKSRLQGLVLDVFSLSDRCRLILRACSSLLTVHTQPAATRLHNLALSNLGHRSRCFAQCNL